MNRIPWLRPVFYLVRKEFQQVFRDIGMVRIVFIMPMIQLFVFGYAVNTDLKHVRLSVLDQDRTENSRELVDAFYSSGIFEPAGSPQSPVELKDLLLFGHTDMTIWIPKGFSRDESKLNNATVGIAVDGQNSSVAGRALGYGQAIVRREAQKTMDAWQAAHPGAPPPARIEAVTRFFYNPELESRFFMIPGIVVLILTIISALLTSMAVVKEKEIGTLEQLMVTPITPLQLIVGKTIPFIVIAYVELVIATTVAVLWYNLPLVGSVWLLVGSAMVYLTVTLGIGLLASTVSHTQQQAMFTVWFFLMFGIMTSGFFYPIANMPQWVQVLTYLNPLRYFMVIVRGVFLRGATFADVIPQVLPLAILGVIMFSVAVLRFHKTVD